MTIKVKCSYVIEVELPPDFAADLAELRFRIEENGCPGTGVVGAEFDYQYEKAQHMAVCWACNLQGENKIVEINGKGVTE